MALLPSTWPGLLALALVVVGLAAAVWRRYPMSYTMGLLCIGVYVVQLGSGAMVRCSLEGLGFRSDCVIAELSFIAPLVATGDRVLSPFTYMFVHADLMHLAGNLFILLTAGPALEERIGSRNFLVIYLLAGLGAAGASVGLWQVGFFTGGEEFSPNVGASGAIFGVLTAFATLFPREKLPMILPFMFFVFWLPSVTVLLLHGAINVIWFVQSVYGSGGSIAWWGHFAGIVVGLVAAPLLHKHLPARKLQEALQVDTEALRPVARSHMERSALRELERLKTPQTKDDRLLAETWWERFLHSAHCPQCGRKLEQKGKDLTCPFGDFAVQALR